MSDETLTPQIAELIDEPDNVEKLRDHIAVIIKSETTNQLSLALEKYGEVKEVNEFNFRVFIENARPYDAGENPPITPFINIMLQKVTPMDGNPRMGNQKEKAVFLIDCISFGNEGGEKWSEKIAAIRAWKAARVIRRIIMSDQYAYLGLRGTVGARNITSMESGVPENGGDALAIVDVRITLEVQFVECAIGSQGPIIGEIDYTVDPVSGEVSIN